MRDLPLWRSLLFVPLTVPKFVAGAAARGADAIILDLEDSVALAEKPRARTLIPEAIATVGAQGADVLIRINRPWRLAVADIEAAVLPGVHSLMLTKVETPEQVRFVAEMVDELEAERGIPAGQIGFVVLVEDPGGFFRLRDIAAAHPRIVAVSLGAEDFTRAVGMAVEPEGLLYPKQQVIFAAKAAGVLALGVAGSMADVTDIDGLRLLIRRSRKLGFTGVPCLHPAQVVAANEEFRPSAQEVASARRIVEVYDKALADGIGAVKLDGRMVDIPVADRARAVITLHEAIEAKASRFSGGVR